MRIDLEQFLAIAVAIGTVGAVGVATYTATDGLNLTKVADSIPTADDFDQSDEEAAAAEAAAAAAAAALPIAAEPDPEDGPISPVVPDEDPVEAYGAPAGAGWGGGPDTETPDW